MCQPCQQLIRVSNWTRHLRSGTHCRLYRAWTEKQHQPHDTAEEIANCPFCNGQDKEFRPIPNNLMNVDFRKQSREDFSLGEPLLFKPPPKGCTQTPFTMTKKNPEKATTIIDSDESGEDSIFEKNRLGGIRRIHKPSTGFSQQMITEENSEETAPKTVMSPESKRILASLTKDLSCLADPNKGRHGNPKFWPKPPPKPVRDAALKFHYLCWTCNVYVLKADCRKTAEDANHLANREKTRQPNIKTTYREKVAQADKQPKEDQKPNEDDRKEEEEVH